LLQLNHDRDKRLGEILMQKGLINEQDLQQALQIQKVTNERLGKTLIYMGLVSDKDITNILEFKLNVKRTKVSIEPDSALISILPEDLINRHNVMPVKKEGNKLTVAMTGSLNLTAMDDIRLVTGNEVVPLIVPEEVLEQGLKKYFGAAHVEKSLQDFEVLESETLQVDRTEDNLFNEAPIVRLVNSIIVDALKDGASDIHIEPRDKGARVRYRVDGILQEVIGNLTPRSQSAITSRIKILADLNIAEKRIPQDGRIKIRYNEHNIDLRISTMPTIFGEKVVIRILDQENGVFTLDQLGLDESQLQQIRSIINRSHGMVLLTGPTGSGKTTTLYAALNELNSSEKNIITIEDPVEYILQGINQIQVNAKAGLSFATGLRSVVRQDPDIIMVGEIRDFETAAIATQAASTGHLVLSTLHTTDASGALLRLIEMGVEPFRVASSVLAVAAQRLVRKICPMCRKSYTVSAKDPEFLFCELIDHQEIQLFDGSGCDYCNYTGYRGRTSLQEILIITDQIRTSLITMATTDKIKENAAAQGMVTLKEDGLRKAFNGTTTVREVMKVVPN